MRKIETMLKNLLEVANINQDFIIYDEILYMLTPKEPTITAYFSTEGEVDYAEIFNTSAVEVCVINDINHVCYANNTITIDTKDYKITLNSSGCGMILL